MKTTRFSAAALLASMLGPGCIYDMDRVLPANQDGPGDLGAAEQRASDGAGADLQLVPIGTKYYCRNYSPDGSFSQSINYSWTGCPLATADQFQILTPYRNVTLDWYHVFRMN